MKNEKITFLSSMGMLGWLGFWVWSGTWHPLEKDWVELLLLLAILVLVPVGMHRSGVLVRRVEQYGVGLASWGVLAAFSQEQGLWAALLTLPWLLVSIIAMGKSLQSFLLSKRTGADLARFAAFLYLPVGTASVLSDRLGLTPLGFSPIIILLTAAHFHYAGFLLHWITAAVLGHTKPSRSIQLLTSAVVLGVPALAVGITLSQFGAPAYFETAAATLMAGGGLGVAVLHMRQAFAPNISLLRRLGFLGIFCCLGAGMALAILYGWRVYFPLPFLSIPWMYALHGSLNTLGVGVLGVLVWGND